MVPPSTKKPKVFTVTLTDEEHARMMALAQADGRSAANWVRNAINTSFEARGLSLKKKPQKK